MLPFILLTVFSWAGTHEFHFNPRDHASPSPGTSRGAGLTLEQVQESCRMVQRGSGPPNPATDRMAAVTVGVAGLGAVGK